jgi:hypothetical protein
MQAAKKQPELCRGWIDPRWLRRLGGRLAS